MIQECSSLRRSNIRTEPSAPTEANSSLPEANAMSYTSLSWAINCVVGFRVCMSQMVHVVSMLDVPKMFGSTEFQSIAVRGAQYSLFLLLLRTHCISTLHTSSFRSPPLEISFLPFPAASDSSLVLSLNFHSRR